MPDSLQGHWRVRARDSTGRRRGESNNTRDKNKERARWGPLLIDLTTGRLRSGYTRPGPHRVVQTATVDRDGAAVASGAEVRGPGASAWSHGCPSGPCPSRVNGVRFPKGAVLGHHEDVGVCAPHGAGRARDCRVADAAI